MDKIKKLWWKFFDFPSMSQPGISFLVSHRPSSLFNFFSEIGSPPLCCVMLGGGNIQCTPNNITLGMYTMLSFVLLLD